MTEFIVIIGGLMIGFMLGWGALSLAEKLGILP